MQKTTKDKPGLKTSEFWLAAGATAIMGLVNLDVLPDAAAADPHAWASKIATALAAMWGIGQYILARTNLKQGPAPDRDEVRESLAAIRELTLRLPTPAEAPQKPAQ